MTKDDLIKLAMPASIALLAISVFAAPMIVKAQLQPGNLIKVAQFGTWSMSCD
ncbi:hypothetical protein [Synechococcus sp. MIT S1220]|uniref:hypothetical protein n=1 Tax=Synechococcus sp. MIT S1220 TaxID=3082549 RepID=UPI0039AF42F6